jgi:transcriptional regulator with GAF, ATPase, and Fis domain
MQRIFWIVEQVAPTRARFEKIYCTGLDVVGVHLPPLRERSDELPLDPAEKLSDTDGLSQ